MIRLKSGAMFTSHWLHSKTVLNPLELQVLLEDQTATKILFQSYAATTKIDHMTWLACISHYVRGHVHKRGQNCNGTEMKIKREETGKRKGGGGSLSLPFSFFPHRPPFHVLFTFASPWLFRVFPTIREIGTGYWPADYRSQRVRGHSKCTLVNLSQRQRRKTIERRLAVQNKSYE